MTQVFNFSNKRMFIQTKKTVRRPLKCFALRSISRMVKGGSFKKYVVHDPVVVGVHFGVDSVAITSRVAKRNNANDSPVVTLDHDWATAIAEACWTSVSLFEKICGLAVESRFWRSA